MSSVDSPPFDVFFTLCSLPSGGGGKKKKATSFSCSLGAAMGIAMIPLLEQLEEKPLEERPVLYACEQIGGLREYAPFIQITFSLNVRVHMPTKWPPAVGCRRACFLCAGWIPAPRLLHFRKHELVLSCLHVFLFFRQMCTPGEQRLLTVKVGWGTNCLQSSKIGNRVRGG